MANVGPLSAALSAALSGRYAVEREIGRGGMATVYLARDVRHHRPVAIKVLDPELGAVLGAERFLSEIRVTANLQHPHLLPLFDSGEADGLLYYVMPFVEGETLRARLDREKQLPVDEAVRIGVAVAGALEYAHQHGVVHRDLKPENILLTAGYPAGGGVAQPVVADFGIALAVSKAGGQRVTQTGLSLGTPQYMSPEQATGDRQIDGRSDIYSLGAVVYEMLAGEPPHLGGTVQAIIAKVLTDRPQSLRLTRPAVPEHVDAAVLHALEKLPADRFQAARELAEALQGRGAVATPAAMTAARPAPAAARARDRWLVPALAAALVVAAALAGRAWTRHPAAPAEPPVRFAVALPAGMSVDNLYAPVTIAPDGRTIVFRGVVDGRVQLVKRRMGALEPEPLPGTENGGWPSVSPDSRWVAFLANGELRKAPLDGGPATSITGNLAVGSGMDWVSSDLLVHGNGARSSGLSLVPLSGGAIRALTTVDSARGELWHRWPRVLPDRKSVAFVVWPRDGLRTARIGIASLETGRHETLDLIGTNPIGVVEGHLLYVRADGVLMAVPFDLDSRKMTGPPVALLEGINVNQIVGSARIGLSATGTLVYLAGTGTSSKLVAVTPAGAARALIPHRGQYSAPAWSPDGRRIALTVTEGADRDIWLYDVGSRALTRLTTDGISLVPSWTADGRRVVYISLRGGPSAVWAQPADGSGRAEKLFESTTGGIAEAALSADGRTLVFRDSRADLQYVDLAGSRKPVHFSDSRFDRIHPAISPDGKWLAYATNESGIPQIVVRALPGPGGVTQVSVDGGVEPVWSGDGKQLFWRNGRQVLAAPVIAGAGGTIDFGARRVLFEAPSASFGLLGHQNITVSPDGREFAMPEIVDAEARLVVVTNWASELRGKLAATR